MTDDKGAGEVKYIHRLTWDLEGCFPECPKCAYDKGRKSMEKDFKELLEIAEELVSDHLTACEEYAIVPHLDDRLADWKKARGIE